MTATERNVHRLRGTYRKSSLTDCKKLNENYVLSVQLGKFRPSRELWPHPGSQNFPRANPFQVVLSSFSLFSLFFYLLCHMKMSISVKLPILEYHYKWKHKKEMTFTLVSDPFGLSLEGNIKFTLFTQDHRESIEDMYPGIKLLGYETQLWLLKGYVLSLDFLFLICNMERNNKAYFIGLLWDIKELGYTKCFIV